MNPGSLPPKKVLEPSAAKTVQSPLQTRYMVETIRGFAAGNIIIDPLHSGATRSRGRSSGKLTDIHDRAVRREFLVKFRWGWIIRS